MEELLSEESYQNANKKVKLIGIIIMILGLLLIAGGIYFIISASNMQVPNIGSSNWFNASSSQMQTKSNGIFMIIPGIFLTIVGIIVRFIMGNQRKIMAYQMQQMIPLVTEGAEKMTPTVTKLAKEVSEEMAPVYGKFAKEISKGIKEGLDDK